jgi:AcrR family transcriptional regulator
MARTQAADYEERREAIVEAAAELYADHGFLGASLVDLATRCNSSKSLIYHYYASKEDILFDVMSSHIEALNAAADAIDAETSAPDVKLRKLAHAFMALYVGAAARHKVLLNELNHLPDARRTQIVRRQRRLITVVESLLAEIQPKLKRSKDLARPATMLFFGMINWTHTWYDPAGRASPAKVADLTVDIMLDGLRSLGRRSAQPS